MTRPLSLRLLGSFAVIWPAGIVLPTRKAGALLAYLAMPAGQPRPRGELATLLWGSRDDRQARHSLNQAVSSLRKLLSPHLPGLLQFDLQTVALNPGLVDTDVARLEAALANGAHGQVAEIYGGELLQGLDIREEAFEGWLAGERSRLRDVALAGLRRLFADQCEAGEDQAAAVTGASVLALDPLDEATLRQLMELQAGSGRRNAALQQYRHFADLLRHELDTAPEAETRALHQRLLRDPPRSATPPEPLRLARAPVRPPEVVVARFGADAGDAAARAVADELRDDLLTALTRRRGLRVLTEAGDGLVADPRAQDRRYLVEAGVRIRAAEVVVTARLMDAGDRSCLWSERCAGPPDRLLGPEVPLAQRLAVSFVREIEIAEARKAAGTEPDALDAWSHYHLALHHLYRFSLPGLNAAHAHLQRAVALDPGLAVAHARLAYAHLQMYWYGPPEARDESLDRSQLAALQAVGLDAKDARGHFALGRLFAIRREFDMAIPEFETAIGLDPSFAQASFGLGQALAAAAQPASSVPFLDRAIDLDPHDPHLWTFYHDRAEARFALGDLAEAAKNSKVAVRLPNASHFAWATLASVLGVAGDQENAGRALARLRLFRPGYSLDHAVAELAHHANRLFVGDYLAGLELAGLGHEQPGTADEDGRQADQGPLLTGQGPLF